MPARVTTTAWLWGLLPLLLAAALVTMQLDDMAFNGDEKDSLYAAGINNAGPRNLAEVWEFIAETHPTQTQGWSKLLFVWGRIAGWSEPVIRSLSLFAGLLTLAWVYRSGRDFFGPQAGLVAALMLATSVVFLAHMGHASAFPLVSLFTALILWSYWRVALHPRPPGPGAQAGLLLGSSWSWRDVPFPIAATRMITPEGSTSGFLVMDRDLSGGGRVNELYTGAYEKRQMWLYSYTTSDTLFRRAQEFDLVWLMLRSSQEQALHLPAHIERFTQDGWFHCRSWQDSGVALELLLAPLSTARGRLQFESAATLFAPDEPQLLDGRLRLRTGLRSEDYSFLDRHSLAIHIIDSRSGERVAQADTGVGPGNYVPLCQEIDVSALPPGDYEVRVALYDWQTGARLIAHDLETGAIGDMHTLHRFRSG